MVIIWRENERNKISRSYKEIKKMALLTFEEKQFIEKKITENTLRKRKDVVQCPKCQAYCFGNETSRIKITCKKCQILKKTTDFCSKCLHSWRGTNSCGNIECIEFEKEKEKVLSSGKTLIIRGNKVNSLQTCPFCGIIIEFYSKVKSCKTVFCICGKRFCVICLRFNDDFDDKTLCWDEENPNSEIDLLDPQRKCVLVETK